MRTDRSPALVVLLFAAALVITSGAAAQATPPANAVTRPIPDADPTIYPLRHIGGPVTPPTLLSHVIPRFSEQARKAKFSGIVLVNLIVDTNGRPRNVNVLHGAGMGLDQNAVAAVKQYTFNPAMEGGKPVPVELNLQVNFHIFEPPKVLHSVPLELSDEARQKHAGGTVLVAFIVDTNGNPRNVHVLHGVGMGMDEKAVKAISQYKFAPFLKNGQPVAQQTTLHLKFDAK